MKPFSRNARIKLISFVPKARPSSLFHTARTLLKKFAIGRACLITVAWSFWGSLQKQLNDIISCLRSSDFSLRGFRGSSRANKDIESQAMTPFAFGLLQAIIKEKP